MGKKYFWIAINGENHNTEVMASTRCVLLDSVNQPKTRTPWVLCVHF